jgi:hypothetical protein
LVIAFGLSVAACGCTPRAFIFIKQCFIPTLLNCFQCHLIRFNLCGRAQHL